MRRKDKELEDPSVIESNLAMNRVLRVAWATEEGPYLLPLNYGYREGRISIHTASEGRKIEISKTNPKVCFEVSVSIEILEAETPFSFTTIYRCDLGTGTIHVVTIMEQITGRSGWKFPPHMMERLLILRIDRETLTGKKSKI